MKKKGIKTPSYTSWVIGGKHICRILFLVCEAEIAIQISLPVTLAYRSFVQLLVYTKTVSLETIRFLTFLVYTETVSLETFIP